MISLTLTTAFKAPTLTYEQLMRKFAVKAEQEGQAVVLPIDGITYVHLQITQKLWVMKLLVQVHIW